MTYSLANLTVGTVVPQGRLVDNANQPLAYQVSDNVVNSAGAEQNAMMLGTPFLCRGPDGSQAWFVYDAELSIPGVRRVLRRM